MIQAGGPAGGVAGSAAMILVLGGTGEARELAAGLHARGVAVTSSLAGRVEPAAAAGGGDADRRVRRAGGARALDRRARASSAVVDATHPFAQRISASAAQACPRRACRCCGSSGPGGASVPATAGGGSTISPKPRPRAGGHRVLLTTGRQGLAAFAACRRRLVSRALRRPAGRRRCRAQHELLLDRGPYTLRRRARAHRRAPHRPRRDEGQRRAAHGRQARRGARAGAAGRRRAQAAARGRRRPSRRCRRHWRGRAPQQVRVHDPALALARLARARARSRRRPRRAGPPRGSRRRCRGTRPSRCRRPRRRRRKARAARRA